MLLPYGLDAYGACIHKKLHELGVAAGICSESDSHAEGAAKFIHAVREMNARLGIPDRIHGIGEEDIPEMARHAEKEANPLYPVPRLMTRKELEGFYRQIADWSK